MLIIISENTIFLDFFFFYEIRLLFTLIKQILPLRQNYIFLGGYSVDRTVGNTGGLGGLFGILQAVGSK